MRVVSSGRAVESTSNGASSGGGRSLCRPKPAPDAALDAAPDAALDAALDAASDAALDAAPDAALDAAPDAALDPPAAGSHVGVPGAVPGAVAPAAAAP